MSSTNSQSYLTPTGVSTPLKDALLARFPHVRAAFNQTAFIESLSLPHQVLADIWLPVGFPPVSFEPLNEEEEKVAQSGQFTNANIRSRNNPNYNQGTGSPNEFRSNRGNNQNSTGRQQRSRGSSFASNNATSNPRAPRHEFSHNQQYQSYSYDNVNDDVIEDPDNLWVTPSSDAINSSEFGTFDENGMFRTGAIPSSLDAELETFSSPSAATAFESFMQTRPHHASVPEIPVPSAAPAAPAVAIPHITPDTQWLYRDPSGQIQGPFPSYRMLEWYNGKYFPENLPLRREQDHFFEPLSTWKTKCAGQIPFAAYSKEPEKPAEPVNLFGTRRTENISISQWFTTSEAEKTNKTERTEVSAVTSTASATSASKTFTTATATGNTSTSSISTSTNAPRSVPIESLFAAKPQPVIEKPSSPEVMMPGASAGWKKLEKPSITTKFGQLDINQPETETSIMNVSKPVETETVIKSSPIVAAEPVKPAPAPLATSSWSNSSASNGSLKKISLSEILKSSEELNIVLEKEKPATSEPVIIPANSAGWAKLSASPVQSLSSIQAEEAARQRASNPSASLSAASKSFADLVRSAGVITSGDIVVSPVSDRLPLVKERSSQSVTSTTATTGTTTSSSTLKQTTVKPSTSTSTSSSAPVAVAVSSSSPKTVSVEDWCLSSLKQSSLSKSIDPQTCTILLMEMPNPLFIFIFVLETLKPMDQGNFDLAAFAEEFSLKRFGAEATDKVQWTKLKNVPQVKKQEESFEVVKRKK